MLHAVCGVSPGEPRERAHADGAGVPSAATCPIGSSSARCSTPCSTSPCRRARLSRSLEARPRREKLVELVSSVVLSRGSRGGPVVVVEDLHWMDESSLECSGTLARRIGRPPVLLLLTTGRPRASPYCVDAEVTRLALAELIAGRVARHGARGARRRRPRRLRSARRSTTRPEATRCSSRRSSTRCGSRAFSIGSSARRRSPVQPSSPPSRSPTACRGCSCRASTDCRPTPGRCSRPARSWGRSFDDGCSPHSRCRAAPGRARVSPSASWWRRRWLCPAEEPAR